MAKLGLALNGAKTAIRDARRERFDFLGYSFGPHHCRKDGGNGLTAVFGPPLPGVALSRSTSTA
jgi:RNA-directed DNA polymerase